MALDICPGDYFKKQSQSQVCIIVFTPLYCTLPATGFLHSNFMWTRITNQTKPTMYIQYKVQIKCAQIYGYVNVKTTPCIQAAPYCDGGQDALPVLSHVDKAATRIKLTKYEEWNEYFSPLCTHDSCTNSRTAHALVRGLTLGARACSSASSK